jgi:para-aminobenzoate synthetase / 4-amino-4-deoxychorismate lyase
MDSAPPHGTSFSLLETMRLEQGRIERLERHIARVAEAARFFGYQWNEAAVRGALAERVGQHAHGCWRMRLLLSADGRPAIECTPHNQEARTWRLAFAHEPVDAHDPFVRHKTTRRAVYEAARASRPEVDDVLLWNQQGDVTESTIANVVAEIDGMRYTPPIHCGLLGGTFRAELLDAGTIRERVLSKVDVMSASRVWLINSVRGWIAGEMAGGKPSEV